jgi:hypothetical protein
VRAGSVERLGEYLFDVHNHADHANSLVREAQAALERDDLADCEDCLKRAREAASKTEMHARWAIEKIKGARGEL